VVIGAEVAQRLGYGLGEKITLAHGMSEYAAEHGDKPFKQSGRSCGPRND
jgi:putative ABC transport system permease protein